MFNFQCIIWSETCCGKNAEATENGHIFQFLSIFQRSVTHSRVARAARQAVAIKARVCFLLVCDYSILACIVLVLVLIYKILRKSRVFLNFF
jgi:hypothetical protein